MEFKNVYFQALNFTSEFLFFIAMQQFTNEHSIKPSNSTNNT